MGLHRRRTTIHQILIEGGHAYEYSPSAELESCRLSIPLEEAYAAVDMMPTRAEMRTKERIVKETAADI